MSVYELSSKEIYDAYSDGKTPQELITEGRNPIAARLQREKNLPQKEAYFAADQMLKEAQKGMSTQA